MDKNLVILVVLGLVVCGALFFLVDIYAMLIGLVLLVALAMSVFIMQDSVMTPDVVVRVREDGRGIVVRNRGNATALSIRLTLIPLDLQFKIPSLEEDAVKDIPTDVIIERVKVTAEYQNEEGRAFAKKLEISVHDKPDEDLLKPVFPLFKWK